MQRMAAAYRRVLAAAGSIQVAIDPAAWQGRYRSPADVNEDVRRWQRETVTERLSHMAPGLATPNPDLPSWRRR